MALCSSCVKFTTRLLREQSTFVRAVYLQDSRVPWILDHACRELLWALFYFFHLCSKTLQACSGEPHHCSFLFSLRLLKTLPGDWNGLEMGWIWSSSEMDRNVYWEYWIQSKTVAVVMTLWSHNTSENGIFHRFSEACRAKWKTGASVLCVSWVCELKKNVSFSFRMKEKRIFFLL